jgi:hypothetical protein
VFEALSSELRRVANTLSLFFQRTGFFFLRALLVADFLVVSFFSLGFGARINFRVV